MKASQIAKICKDMANLDLPTNCYQQPTDDYKVSAVATKLLVCCNFVLEQIYCDFATSIGVEVVKATGNVVDTQNLSLSKVVKLTDSFGNDVPFRYTERGLFVESDGVYNLTYAKLPAKVEWNEEFLLPTPRITPTVFALGVLAEYFAILGDVDQEERYRKKYQECLRLATRKISPQKLPVRRWWR